MKPGDYVAVKNNVHDSSMPDDRRDGIVLEAFGSDYKNPDQATVLFYNGSMLKFHKSQLIILKSLEQFYL
jgi:hypothetical protein